MGNGINVQKDWREDVKKMNDWGLYWYHIRRLSLMPSVRKIDL